MNPEENRAWASDALKGNKKTIYRRDHRGAADTFREVIRHLLGRHGPEDPLLESTSRLDIPSSGDLASLSPFNHERVLLLSTLKDLARGQDTDSLLLAIWRLGQLRFSLGDHYSGKGNIEEATRQYHDALEFIEATFDVPVGPRRLESELIALGMITALLTENKAWSPNDATLNGLSIDAIVQSLESGSEHDSLFVMAPVHDALSLYLTAFSKLQPKAKGAYKLLTNLAYEHVKLIKSTVTRRLRSRQLIRDNTYESWVKCRQRLSSLFWASAKIDDEKEWGRVKDELVRLCKEKEEFERQLRRGSTSSPFGQALPGNVVVIDLYRYSRFPCTGAIPRAMQNPTPAYIGFVTSSIQPLRAIDFPSAEEIDDVASSWRRDAAEDRPSLAAQEFLRLVWYPLARHIPPATNTILIAPDGALCFVPWGALPIEERMADVDQLPGIQAGKILLEKYALATIPDVSFLDDQLGPSNDMNRKGSEFLALGGVDYDQEPSRPAHRVDGSGSETALPSEFHNRLKDAWPGLPGTVQELDAITALADQKEVIRLTGREASTDRLLNALRGARWAHLATHGFFIEPGTHSNLQTDLAGLASGESTNGAVRIPLSLSGLVLAGANLRRKTDLLFDEDPGILTAEAIAGLPLQNLQLVVLSACESGLGRTVNGEGAFGLQRAFHTAGAQNVVASLWKVDDQATASLMALLYDRLWRKNEPPIEALRNAQLTIYYHPELIGELAMARATPDFSNLVQRPEQDHVPGPHQGTIGRAPARYWAAFVLSGYGK
jgi:CHAT domain-containing protein